MKVKQFKQMMKGFDDELDVTIACYDCPVLITEKVKSIALVYHESDNNQHEKYHVVIS